MKQPCKCGRSWKTQWISRFAYRPYCPECKKTPSKCACAPESEKIMAVGIREATKRAGTNAAGLIEAMDLEQLFGGDVEVEGNEEVFHEAQKRVVAYLTKKYAER
jgi:hypothetical protein